MKIWIITILFLFSTLYSSETIVYLPKPKYKSNISLEETLYRRKSYRYFKNKKLTLAQVGQLLWSAGGTNIDGISGATRVYPSAGGIYSTKIYLVSNNVENLNSGLYLYEYQNHNLKLIKEDKSLQYQVANSCFNQKFISQAAISIIFVSEYKKTSLRYGDRGKERYINLDIGHSAQNVCLQCVSLGLGTVPVGAFNDNDLAKILNLKKDEIPVYVLPIGYVE
jgi:SagB-type dehydrogenase family enzyme